MDKIQKLTRVAAEIRALPQQDDSNEMILEGYAATFDSPTVMWSYEGIDYKELIDKKAFDKTIFKDCCMKYNHSDNIPILARYRGESLKLSVDNTGLYFSARLFNTQTARDVYTLVKDGGLDKCSFAFNISDMDGDSYDMLTHTRTILNIERLWDVSIVDVPAYESTSVQARSYFQTLDSDRKALESVRQKEIKKLILKTFL